MVGDFEVTALSDGTVALPVDQLLTRTTPAQVKKTLAKSYLQSPLETSVNAYLVNTGDKLVLIDTGAARPVRPDAGQAARPTSRPPATSPSRWTRSTSPTCTPTTSAA